MVRPNMVDHHVQLTECALVSVALGATGIGERAGAAEVQLIAIICRSRIRSCVPRRAARRSGRRRHAELRQLGGNTLQSYATATALHSLSATGCPHGAPIHAA